MAISSPSDDIPDTLLWTDDNQSKSILSTLHAFQRSKQFCDVTLVVEDHEIAVHRAVLASCSPFFLNLFNMSQENDPTRTQFRLKDLDYCSFSHILDFAYTSQLQIPYLEVQGVYTAAIRLKISSVMEACSSYLSEHLSARNCLTTRLLAKDDMLKERSNTFIQNNLSEVLSGYYAKSLLHIQVEIIGATGLTGINNEEEFSKLFHLVMNWLKEQFRSSNNVVLEDFTNHVHILYLNMDNTLTDCNDLDEKSDLNNTDIIKDYKSISKKHLSTGAWSSRDSLNRIDPTTPTESPVLGRHRRHSPQSDVPEEWSIIATQTNDETFCLGLSILNGTMVTISLRLSSGCGSGLSDAGSEGGADVMVDNLVERHSSLALLAPMSSARCAAGVATINGKLIVCGGYDRGECLETTELYDVESNEWVIMASMNAKRGRIDVAVISDLLYVCGGSDGNKDLMSVEQFDLKLNKWTFVSDISAPLCHAGVASMNGRLYVIGGSTGVASSDVCQSYDPVKNEWFALAPLALSRSQAAVCEYMGTLFVIGGTDSWSVITPSVEMYDIENNSWANVAPLNTPRRGAAAVVCTDKLYIIGGNDGTQSLATTEIYDPERNCWTYGPSMAQPRANNGAATIDDKIFVVGGFTGKNFLDSIEYLDPVNNEWCMYVTVTKLRNDLDNKPKSSKQNLDFTEGLMIATNSVSEEPVSVRNFEFSPNSLCDVPENPNNISEDNITINKLKRGIAYSKAGLMNDDLPVVKLSNGDC